MSDEEIPSFQPLEAYSSRSNNTPISKYEWIDENEVEMSRLWNSLNNYLDFNNVEMLDKCKYTDFCNFVASYTTHRLKYENNL